MKVIHLCKSDINGGAARAAYRIHRALLKNKVDSRMWVNEALTDDWTVQGPITKFAKLSNIVRPHVLGYLIKPLFSTGNRILHSPALLPSSWIKKINTSDADLIHLHWLQGEMLSVADIGRISKPVVWTLHDMWALCGTEHYTEDFRWRDGYFKGNRPDYESGIDLNRWVWNRKRRHWRTPRQIVTPSRWLADCVKTSVLMHYWPIEVIPNCLHAGWIPVETRLARKLLGLPQDKSLLLFGAMGGTRDRHKGFDLLIEALPIVRGLIAKDSIEIVVFGQSQPENPADLGYVVHYLGHLHDDLSLRILYSAVDLLVVPSRQDNLVNTGVEALSCGTPVVAFDTCGMPDIVDHKVTGYLARAFDRQDLAEGIVWVINNSKRKKLGVNARAKAEKMFSADVVSDQYKKVYNKVIGSPNKSSR